MFSWDLNLKTKKRKVLTTNLFTDTDCNKIHDSQLYLHSLGS